MEEKGKKCKGKQQKKSAADAKDSQKSMLYKSVTILFYWIVNICHVTWPELGVEGD